MIDKARVKRIRNAALGQQKQSRPQMTMITHIMVDLTTDYLALREIVEALAERPAVQYVKAGTRDAHYVCSFCRRVNWNNQNIDHDESCLWAQARALVGPASGARTEES